MNQSVKKAACFLPGLGTPISLYYAATNKDLRGTALKGLAMIPAATLVVAANSIMPGPITLLASAHLYWSVLALAGSWGFIAMLMGYRMLEGRILKVEPVHISTEAPELIPNASASEVLPDLDASAILSGIEQMPEEEREELVAKIMNK